MRDSLAHLAKRLAGDPTFIAEHVTTAALVATLGCDELTAVKLRLCRLPRDAGDLRRIAERFAVDVDALGRLLT